MVTKTILMASPKFQRFPCQHCRKHSDKEIEIKLRCRECKKRYVITDIEFENAFYDNVDKTVKRVLKAFTYGNEIKTENGVIVEKIDKVIVLTPERYEKDMIELRYLLENNGFNVGRIQAYKTPGKIKHCTECRFCRDCFTCRCGNSGFNKTRCPSCKSYKTVKQTWFRGKACPECKSKNARETTMSLDSEKCPKCGSEKLGQRDMIGFSIIVKKGFYL